MKISEEDLKDIFNDEGNLSQKRENEGDKVVVKKTKSTHEISKIRKTLRRVSSGGKSKLNYSELLNSALRFLVISGFSGFILFIAMSWGGLSKQLEWGYFVSYLNEQPPQTISAVNPRPIVTRPPRPSVVIPSPAASTLTRPTAHTPTPTETNFTINSLKIEKINISVPVLWNIEEDDILEKLKDGVVHYQGTSLPGEGGNIFIVGHSSNYFWIHSDYNNVLALLDKLSPGDRIELSTDKMLYVYEVKSTNIVRPNEIQVLENTPKETLSLMTCWPIGTSLKRMIVQSELLYSTN
jgi:sortase A